MSIKHAILGILSCRAASGYEMKKIMRDSPFMYWSGNNNQIYKALLELSEEGAVTSNIEHQTGLPSKKVYFITEEGLAELKEWLLEEPALPEFKNNFLIQLAWSELLSNEQLLKMLANYEHQIQLQLLLHKANRQRTSFMPSRSPREREIWNEIYEYSNVSYESELKWIRKVRFAIEQSEPDVAYGESDQSVLPHHGLGELDYEIIAVEGRNILRVNSTIDSPHCGTMIVAACTEQDTNLVLIAPDGLTNDFFKNKTGLAAELIQKFVNYRIRVAAMDSHVSRRGQKAKYRSSRHCKIFTDAEEAFQWLLEPIGETTDKERPQ